MEYRYFVFYQLKDECGLDGHGTLSGFNYYINAQRVR